MIHNSTNPYTEALLAGAKDARWAGTLPPPALKVRNENRLCGDSVELFLMPAGAGFMVRYQVEGCALCRASAALLASFVHGESGSDTGVGKPPSAAQLVAVSASVAAAFGPSPPPNASATWPSGLQSLSALTAFSTRARCVLLPWEALAQLLSRVTISGAAATMSQP